MKNLSDAVFSVDGQHNIVNAVCVVLKNLETHYVSSMVFHELRGTAQKVKSMETYFGVNF